MKNFLLKTWLTMLCLLVGVGTSWAEEVTLDFRDIQNFAKWSTSYSKHEITYDEWGKVTFASANRNTATITSCPVTKGGEVIFQAVNGKSITSLTFECVKWGNKAQTITLHTSKDGGSTFTSSNITSSNFNLTANNLDGVNAVKFTFNSQENQVGIKSLTLEMQNCTSSSETQTHTAHFSINGTIDNANDCTVKEGTNITFPTNPADINGKKFVGWAESTINGITNTAPTFVSSAKMGTSDVTYYAVFAIAEGEETTETFGWEEATTPNNWKLGGTFTRTVATESNPANSGDYYGFTNSNSSVQYSKKVKVKSFSYYCVRRTNNTNTSIKIETSTNGTTWTEALSTTWNTFNSDGKTYKKIEKTWDEPLECYVRVNLVTAAGRQLDDVSITYGDVSYSDYCTTVNNTVPTTYNIIVDSNISNGTVIADHVEAAEGEIITLTATPADGYDFTSWNVTDASGNPITVTDDKFTMPASDVTVSATFTEVQQGGGDEIVGEYVLTAINQIDKEDEVVIVFTNSTASYAMSNDKGTSNAPTAVPVNINEYSISNPADNILWNVSYSNDDKTFIIYPKGSTAKWLYCINNNNGARVGTGENKVFSIDKNYLYNIGQSRYFGVYNNSDIRSYTLNNGEIGTNIAGQTLAFYVKKATPKVIASISLSGEYQTEFFQNQEFNHTGVVVTANYEDESTKDVTEKATFSAPDMTTVGTKTITVSYTEGEVTKTETYNINVAVEELTSIELGGTYTTNFEQNADFNHDGLTVTAHYNSGRTADVTAEATVSTPDMSTLGEQTITVSYGGQEATYTIKVAGYYTVTIDNTNDTHGTISVWNGDVELVSGARVLDGTKLTIKYEITTEFYRFKNWQYKDNSVSKYTSKWDYFDYTIEGSDVSFRINFEEIPLYTITYYVNGVPTTEEVREGSALHFPENPTMAGKVFRGWIDQVKVADKNVEPTYITSPTATEDATYFAVFATETTTTTGGSDYWEKVPHDFNDWTAEGNEYILVYEKSESEAYVFTGIDDSSNFVTAEVSSDGTISKINDTESKKHVIILIEQFNETNGYSLVIKGNSSGYLSGDPGNGLRFSDKDGHYLDGKTAKRTITNIVFKDPYGWIVLNSSSILRYCTVSGQDRFRFYKYTYDKETDVYSGTAIGDSYKTIEFYIKKSGTTTEYSDFTTNMGKEERTDKVADGKYFTICLPYKFHKDAIIGATPYNIVGRNGSSIELDEEEGDLVAGRPYFMVGNSNAFTGYYSLDNEVETAGTNNGLIGTFEQFAFKEHTDIFKNDAEIYVVLDTNIKKAYPTGGGVNAYRAYIDLNQIEDKTTSSVSRIAIDVEGGTTTAIESVEDIEKDNTIYNLQGQRINRADKGVYIVNGRKVIR